MSRLFKIQNYTHHGGRKPCPVHPPVTSGVQPQALHMCKQHDDAECHNELEGEDAVDFADEPTSDSLFTEAHSPTGTKVAPFDIGVVTARQVLKQRKSLKVCYEKKCNE